MFRPIKLFVMVSILFLCFGASTALASESQSSNDESISYYWEQVPELSNEATLTYEDDEDIGTNNTWYDDWGTGSMSLSFSGGYLSGDNSPNAIPVSSITATGETERDDALGTSAVSTLLMMNGREVAQDSDTSTFSKTASATVNTYPGSVANGVEYRAHGTHTITKGLKQSVGYTGDSIAF